MVHSFKGLLIGQERSGKTNAAMNIANLYAKNKGAVLAYNVGKPEDFPDSEYLEIEPIHSEHELRFSLYGKESSGKPKTIDYFVYKNRVHHFSTFSQLFHMKKVKAYRMGTGQDENAIANAIFKYISKTLVIFDDCRAIFSDGLKKGHIDIFSRSNHCGKQSSIVKFRGQGIDILTIWHGADHVNSDFWTYHTFCLLFQFPVYPDFNKMKNPILEAEIKKAKETLDNLPPYHSVQIEMRGGIKSTIIKPLNA